MISRATIQLQTGVSRRTFLKGSASGLVIGMFLPAIGGGKVLAQVSEEGELEANAFIRIAPDNTVTVIIKHIEFGQGTFTGLATLAAEEMDADWGQIRAEHAPANVKLYANLFFGIQGTGGSTAIANSYMTMRTAGAAAKQMLVAAAAKQWDVSADAITVSKGVVTGPGGQTAQFGELAGLAATLSAPTQEPVLKQPEQFVLIGQELPKLDTPAKTRGQAMYTQDVQFDNMVVAVVAHPPLFGAKMKSFNAEAALKVPGVKAVKAIDTGVAVYANSTFNAIKGRRALQVEWDDSQAEKRSSAQLLADFQSALDQPGLVAGSTGDVASLPGNSEKVVDVEMHFPYLAHAPMEPLDAVVQYGGGKATAWLGCQMPTMDQGAIAKVLGLAPEQVEIKTLLAGGSFGRRAQQDSGLAAEAAMLAKAYGQENVPVKLVWTREDDIQGGRYRPMSVHRMRGEVNDQGELLGWQHHIAIQSIIANSPFEAMIEGGIDQTSVEGANNQPYSVPNLDVRLSSMEAGVPVLWWRSVGHTHTGYAVETFIDALLEKADRDPISGRVALLANHPREANVLKVVGAMVDKAGPAPSGRARGVAMVKSFGSYVAQVAEVSKGDDGLPRVHKVWCAVDCGVAVNTNVIKAQIEGGIGYGLDAILQGELTLGEGGKVEQSNFHNYTVLRINQMPEVEVDIVKSAEAPSGVGEVGVPPVGPAVSNAWRRLTGQYVTTLPFVKGVKQSQA